MIRAFTACLIVCHLLAGLAAVGAAQEPRSTVETRQGQIVLRCQPGAEQLAFAVGRAAASALGEVSQGLETAVPGRVVVNVYSSRTAYLEATGAARGNLELGRASTPPDIIHIDATGLLGDVDRITRHEITHIVLNHALGPALDDCPRWVQEGIARYFERPSLTLDPAVQTLLIQRPPVDVERLDRRIEAGGEGGRLAYAQSEALIRWLIERRGPRVLPRLTQALRKYGDLDQALEAAAGMNVRQLQRGWRRSAAWTYLLSSNTPIWLVMTVLLLVTVLLVGLRRRRRRRIQELMEEGFDEGFDQPEERPTIN